MNEFGESYEETPSGNPTQTEPGRALAAEGRWLGWASRRHSLYAAEPRVSLMARVPLCRVRVPTADAAAGTDAILVTGLGAAWCPWVLGRPCGVPTGYRLLGSVLLTLDFHASIHSDRLWDQMAFSFRWEFHHFYSLTHVCFYFKINSLAVYFVAHMI